MRANNQSDDIGIEINEGGNTPTNMQLLTNKIDGQEQRDNYAGSMFNIDNLFDNKNDFQKGMNRAKSGGFLVNRNKNIDKYLVN
jgi:hypothetical protein